VEWSLFSVKNLKGVEATGHYLIQAIIQEYSRVIPLMPISSFEIFSSF
jgi:hypothetical protein